MVLHLVSILYLFLLFVFISLPSYANLFVASSYIVVFLLFSFLLWLSAFHWYKSPYSSAPNFWNSHFDFWLFVLLSFPHFLVPYLVTFWPFIQFFFLASLSFLMNFFGLDSLQSLSFSVNFDFSTLTQLPFYFNFSFFDLADSFYFETLGGVVEFESPNLIDRGFVLHIGNCLGLEGSFSSPPSSPTNNGLPPYSSFLPPDETSSGPPAYSPPTSTSLVPVEPSSSTSTSLVPVEPLPIWLACPDPSNPFFTVPVGDFSMFDSPFTRSYIRSSAPLPSVRDCPEVIFWRGRNFYDICPNYFPVEAGPAHSILKVVGSGPYNCHSINEWRLYPYLPGVFIQDINLSDVQLDFHQHARLLSNVFPSFSYNNISLDIIARSLVDFYPSDSSSPLSMVNDATYINQLFVVMDTQRVILPLLDSIVDHVARCGEIQQTHDEIQLVSDIKNHLLRYHSAHLGRDNIHAFSYHLHNLVVNHPPRCFHTSPKLYLLNHFLSVVSSPSFSSNHWLFSSILFRSYAPFF